MDKYFNEKNQFTAERAEEMFKIQRTACEANEKLFSSFNWNGEYVYPDDYAGDYIDYDVLHVLITNEKAIAYYSQLLSKFSDKVVFDIVKHSYNELFANVERFAQDLKKNYGVVSYGVDVEKNIGFINVLSSDFEKAISYVNSNDILKINGDRNLIEIGQRKCYIQNTASLVAGTQISFVDKSGISHSATLAGSGIYNSKVAFLTCGHGGIYVGADITAGGTAIGTVTKLQYKNNESGDYSIITAKSGYETNSSVFTENGNVMKFGGYYRNPTKGTYLYKYGYVSGQTYCKVVNNPINTISKDDKITLTFMSEALIISGTDAKGNSGGPYRYGDYFCGVHNGCDDPSNPQYVYYTRYGHIYDAGFSIATN